MKTRYMLPSFEAGSYGERARSLVPDDTPWEAGSSGENWLTRSTTWTLWPHRYWAVEDAREYPTLFGRRRIEHCMYRIAMMSALRQDGKRELNQWYIIQRPQDAQEVVFTTEHTVLATPEEEKTAGTYAEAMTFAIDHGLIASNDQDLLELGLAIAIGEERGTQRVG